MSATKGWLSVFALDEHGLLVVESDRTSSGDTGVERWETPTSGGKANAIDVYPKSSLSHETRADKDVGAVWILLTDDDDYTASVEGRGGVRVLEWDGWGSGVKVVAAWPPPAPVPTEQRQGSAGEWERMQGGSHAIWLS